MLGALRERRYVLRHEGRLLSIVTGEPASLDRHAGVAAAAAALCVRADTPMVGAGSAGKEAH